MSYILPKDYQFKKLIADFDTPLFRAAKFVQEDFITVAHKKTGKVSEFRNTSEFWGHWKTKTGGWLGRVNLQRELKGQPPYSAGDFEVEEMSRLSPELHNHLEEATRIFDIEVGRLKKLVRAEDYELALGGSNNFRYDIAMQLPYKGNRRDKPLIFGELREIILKKYKSKIVVAEGREADDYCSEKGYENYQHFLKTKKWLYCLAYIDKDLDMIISPSVNYDIQEQDIIVRESFDAAKAYAVQLLCGDKATDNIIGLPNLSEEFREKYNLRKTSGVGLTTALKCFEGCTKIKCLFERVVEAYKTYYGEETYNFINYKGVECNFTWKDFLEDNARLLWLYKKPDQDYSIFRDTLGPLGVDYELS